MFLENKKVAQDYFSKTPVAQTLDSAIHAWRTDHLVVTNN